MIATSLVSCTEMLTLLSEQQDMADDPRARARASSILARAPDIGACISTMLHKCMRDVLTVGDGHLQSSQIGRLRKPFACYLT